MEGRRGCMEKGRNCMERMESGGHGKDGGYGTLILKTCLGSGIARCWG